MNSTQLYEWLTNEGIDEESAKILRGIILFIKNLYLSLLYEIITFLYFLQN